MEEDKEQIKIFKGAEYRQPPDREDNPPPPMSAGEDVFGRKMDVVVFRPLWNTSQTFNQLFVNLIDEEVEE